MRSQCFIDSLRITPDYESIMKQIKCLLGWIIIFSFLIMDKNEWFRFSFILCRYIRACMYNKKFLLSILLERTSVLVYLVHFSFLFLVTLRLKSFEIVKLKFVKHVYLHTLSIFAYNARLLHLIFKQIKRLLRWTCHKYRFLFLPVFGFIFTIMDKGLDFFSHREIGITPALNFVARCINTAVFCVFFFF